MAGELRRRHGRDEGQARGDRTARDARRGRRARAARRRRRERRERGPRRRGSGDRALAAPREPARDPRRARVAGREPSRAAARRVRGLARARARSAARRDPRGMAAAAEDVRERAVDALVPLARARRWSPPGLVADALRDAGPSPAVRRRAFAALRQIASPLDAVRTALARGAPDIRAQALLVLGFATGRRRRRMLARSCSARSTMPTRPCGLGVPRGDHAAPAARTGVARARAEPRAVARSGRADAADTARVRAGRGRSARSSPTTSSSRCSRRSRARAADAAIRGAGALIALGDPRAIGAVLQLTRETDPASRRGAVANLVAALARWPDDDRLQARLAWLLDDPDAEVRAAAFDGARRVRATARRGRRARPRRARAALQPGRSARPRAADPRARRCAGARRQRARGSACSAMRSTTKRPKCAARRFARCGRGTPPTRETPIARGAASRHGDLRGQVVAEIARRRVRPSSRPPRSIAGSSRCSAIRSRRSGSPRSPS